MANNDRSLSCASSELADAADDKRRKVKERGSEG
jgi:hypothetical protein